MVYIPMTWAAEFQQFSIVVICQHFFPFLFQEFQLNSNVSKNTEIALRWWLYLSVKSTDSERGLVGWTHQWNGALPSNDKMVYYGDGWSHKIGVYKLLHWLADFD